MHSHEFPPVVLRFAWMIFWSCGSGWIGRGGGKEASKMCKVNDASHVRINPPQRGSGRPEGNRPLPHDDAVILEYSPVFLCLRFCLPSYMRQNYYYRQGRSSHDQTPSARPEDRGAEADRHAQSPCGIRDRSPVPTESLLRSPGSSAGPLRDAATPHRRTDVDSRGGGCLWRVAPHVLSSSSVFPTIGTGGPFAGSPGAQGWAQADRRSSGLRGQLAGVRTQAHPRSVRQSHSTTFCHDHPPAQPGAGSGAAQKKTAWPDLKSSLPADAAAAYEALRPYLIHSADQSGATCGPAVLLRHGMLAWLSASKPVPASAVSPRPAGGPPVPSEVSRELVQVMAGLILHQGKDLVYA